MLIMSEATGVRSILSDVWHTVWQHQAGRIVIFAVALVLFLQLAPKVYRVIRAYRRKKKVRDMFAGQATLSPAEFIDLRKVGGQLNAVLHVPGVYVLHNTSKNLTYVGQGKRVAKRVFNHFNGSGNGDVYADYKYGDTFTIQLLALEDSSYDTLDALERYAIEAYSSYSKGYNRNRGNGW